MQNLSNQPAGCTTCFSRSLFLSLSFFSRSAYIKGFIEEAHRCESAGRRREVRL